MSSLMLLETFTVVITKFMNYLSVTMKMLNGWGRGWTGSKRANYCTEMVIRGDLKSEM